MIYFILFTFFLSVFIILISYALFQYFYLKNNKRKLHYFICLPFLCLSLGFLPSTILHIKNTKGEIFFPTVIELPHWKTLQDIDFEQWKNLDFYDSELHFLYGTLEPNNEVSPIVEIKVYEDHSSILDIRFELLLKRYVKTEYENILGMAVYESVYTEEEFYLKRKKFINGENSLAYCEMYDVIELAERIETKNFDIPSMGAYDIRLCFQYAKSQMDFRYQFIDVVDLQNVKHRVFISDRTLWIMPVTYLEVSFVKDDYHHKNLLYFKENLEANTETYLELIKLINNKYYPNQSEE